MQRGTLALASRTRQVGRQSLPLRHVALPPSFKSFRVYKLAKKLQPVGYIRAKNEKEALAQAQKDAPAQDRDRIIVRPEQ